jgi:hypothetical protein
LRYDRQQLVAFSFIILSLGSAIYVSTATLNYLRLFPALDQIQFQVDTLSFSGGSGSNQSALTAHVTVTNPSEYSGLRVAHVTVDISFYLQTNSSVTLFASPNDLNARDQQLNVQLGPRASYSPNIPVGLTAQQEAQLVSFNQKYQNDVRAHVSLRVDINTFLESVTGTIPFMQTQDVLLSSS